MGVAFGGDEPPIDLAHEAGESGISERRGMMMFFKGMSSGIRNPKAHGLTAQKTRPSD